MPRIPRERSSPGIIQSAREMRCGPTPAEDFLWEALRGKQLDCVKFRRQHPAGPYILDFYCMEFKLAIEVDGKGHQEPDQKQYDQERTAFLNKKGITVMRFTNEQVMTNRETVVSNILIWIESHMNSSEPNHDHSR